MKAFIFINMNSFIQISKDNQSRTNPRLDSIKAYNKKVEAQVEKLAKYLQKQGKEQLHGQSNY